MIPLKFSTASQEVPLGYFLDSTNGDTEETALTIANTDIKLWKNGATTLANKNAGGATHISNGIYYAVLDATDTNTYGPLVIFVHVAGALAVKLECVVMEADAFDALYAASGTGVIESDLRQIGGVAQSATDLKDFADAGYDPATNKVQGVVLVDTVTTLTGHTAQTGDSFAVVNSGTFGNAQLVRSTVPANALDVNATGEAGVDWANVGGQGTAVDLSATAINLCDTTTTNTDMRGTDNALLAASAPTNFGDLAITLTTGLVSVGTNNDKTGYSISGAITTLDGLNNLAATDIVSAGAITTLAGAVVNVDAVDTCTTNSDMRGTDSAALASVCTEPRLSELDAATAGKMANQVDIIEADTTVLNDTKIPDTISLANINGEVVDALATDTYAEPGQGAPAATTTLAAKINYVYKAWRNQATQDATTYELYNDAATVVDQKATVADDGTDFTRGKIGSGP